MRRFRAAERSTVRTLDVLALMWCPGVSALATRLVYQHNLRGQGWRPGAPRWLPLAYLLPLSYAGVAYGVVWLLASAASTSAGSRPAC